MASEINGLAVGAPASTFGLRVFTGKQANRIERYSQCLRQALLTVRAASIIFSCGGNANAREKSFKERCHCRACPNFGLDLEDCACLEEAYNRETCCVCETFSAVGHVTPLS